MLACCRMTDKDKKQLSRGDFLAKAGLTLEKMALAFLAVGLCCQVPATTGLPSPTSFTPGSSINSQSDVLFQENFDDINFSSRGWYDGNTAAIDINEHIPGSNASLKCNYPKGETKPTCGEYTLRHTFISTDSVYLSFWVKHSSNWVGSSKPYHPHLIYLLTNLNSAYSGLAYTYLTGYVEENQGYPQMSLQDGLNIDEANIDKALIGVTENRATMGCNGTQTDIGQSSVDCYLSASVHWNGTVWRASKAYFFDANEKTKWHFVEAFLQLNTIANGIGQPDGILRYWYDGQLLIDHSNLIIKTGAHQTMQFNQLIIAPYIGPGSPVDQTIWFDNLVVARNRP